MNKICSKCKFKKELFVIDDREGFTIHDIRYQCKNMNYKRHIAQKLVEDGAKNLMSDDDLKKYPLSTEGLVTTKCAFFKEVKESRSWEHNEELGIKWIKCEERLPKLGDYTVLVCAMNVNFDDSPSIRWRHGSYETVNVDDYFKDIGDGIDENGNQLYSKWYLNVGITHWTYINLPEE